ncbi:MAG TPA: hypothetical protein VN796_03360 [Acidimicrobiales bacterium]|nr:hypothetical protein [Acidimicrobiales bacterium]
MKRRFLTVFSALFLLLTVVALGSTSAGASTTYVTAPCNSIAQDGGTPLSSTDESSCLTTWLATLNLATNTSATPIVWDLGGQSYEVDKGITVAGAQWFTIQNGSFYNAENPNDIAYGGTPTIDMAGAKTYSKNPINGTNDTLQNLFIEGTYPGGGLRADMANASGIRTQGIVNLTISNVTTEYTWGDGLNLGPYLVPPVEGAQSLTGGTVENVVTNHTGRCGIAPIGVNNLTIDNASMTGTGYCAVDMEVDSGNTPVDAVTFNGLTTDSFVELDNVTGPVSISGWTETDNEDPDLLDESDATPLTVDGANVHCGETAGPYPCWDIHGTPEGATISNSVTTMADNAYQNHTPLWSVGPNSPTAFTNDCVTSPGGTYSAGDSGDGAVTVTNPLACPAGTIPFPQPKN